MPELYFSWSEYHQKIEHLAAKIYKSDWQFNQIICIAKGGLRVGDLLSRIYRCPLAILAASSYGGAQNQDRGVLSVARHLTMASAQLGDRILLVDDLVDSGITLQETVDWLQTRYSSSIQDLRTAVIWYKACSPVAPDYYVDYLSDSPWIHQPFEHYETLSPAELALRYLPDTSLEPQPCASQV